jgi:hypothetical protein
MQSHSLSNHTDASCVTAGPVARAVTRRGRAVAHCNNLSHRPLLTDYGIAGRNAHALELHAEPHSSSSVLTLRLNGSLPLLKPARERTSLNSVDWTTTVAHAFLPVRRHRSSLPVARVSEVACSVAAACTPVAVLPKGVTVSS